ncbi:hypothetical protein [Bacillus sp. 2CMS4F]|uniref:hypothetical protein n=1 Tax=Bacillus sp. 2CMS4F TaxID=2929170 RepID=UPI0037C02885
MKQMYLDLIENGYKLHEIDDMDVQRFFDLATYKHEEENKLVPAYQIFGATL